MFVHIADIRYSLFFSAVVFTPNGLMMWTSSLSHSITQPELSSSSVAFPTNFLSSTDMLWLVMCFFLGFL